MLVHYVLVEICSQIEDSRPYFCLVAKSYPLLASSMVEMSELVRWKDLEFLLLVQGLHLCLDKYLASGLGNPWVVRLDN